VIPSWVRKHWDDVTGPYFLDDDSWEEMELREREYEELLEEEEEEEE